MGSGAGSNLVGQGTPREWREKVKGLPGENYFTPKDGVVQPTPSVGETGEGAHHSRINFRSTDRKGACNDTPRDVAGNPQYFRPYHRFKIIYNPRSPHGRDDNGFALKVPVRFGYSTLSGSIVSVH